MRRVSKYFQQIIGDDATFKRARQAFDKVFFARTFEVDENGEIPKGSTVRLARVFYACPRDPLAPIKDDLHEVLYHCLLDPLAAPMRRLTFKGEGVCNGYCVGQTLSENKSRQYADLLVSFVRRLLLHSAPDRDKSFRFDIQFGMSRFGFVLRYVP